MRAPDTNVADHGDQINEFLRSFLDSIRSNYDLEIIKIPEALTLTQSSKSKHYADISAGLMVPGFSTGLRSMSYRKVEVLAVITAQIQGKSKDFIRLLVKELVAQRQNITLGA